jgi:tetratricopeptide (TPR) repeat protein
MNKIILNSTFPFSLLKMSFQKQQLKVARDAIAQKNFDYANDLCENILENDPLNYNALVFAGLAQKELQNYEESLIKYRKATQIQPDNTLAYQVLCRVETGNAEAFRGSS